jgi:hypothetical protein
MWITSFFSTTCWRGFIFSSVCFWFISQRSDGCSCVVLFLGLLFYSIGFHVFFVPISCCFCHYGSLVSFQIQYCDNSSIAVFAQDYFFYSGSFMLHINFSKLTFLFLQRMTSEFSWAWHWICRLLSAVYPFSWYEFWQSMSRGSLSISGVFNIFPQDFTVFIVLFHFLG